ncbi:unnamed protein product [Brassica napus]|uniref:(rape) hypothetical protein n=1 Tax=Brassica napus TaxID=3708 RepID=A0A816TVX6_BRANA|nr:unnamed protein product [Brassica napus]
MFPDLLTSDPESDILPRSRSREVDISLLPKIEYVEEGLGFTREEVAKMVVRSPALLTYSVDNNLAPKVEFLLEGMRGDGKEVKRRCTCVWETLREMRRTMFLKQNGSHRKLDGEQSSWRVSFAFITDSTSTKHPTCTSVTKRREKLGFRLGCPEIKKNYFEPNSETSFQESQAMAIVSSLPLLAQGRTLGSLAYLSNAKLGSVLQLVYMMMGILFLSLRSCGWIGDGSTD